MQLPQARHPIDLDPGSHPHDTKVSASVIEMITRAELDAFLWASLGHHAGQHMRGAIQLPPSLSLCDFLGRHVSMSRRSPRRYDAARLRCQPPFLSDRLNARPVNRIDFRNLLGDVSAAL